MRSEIAERKGIDNNPPQDLIIKMKRICEKVLEVASQIRIQLV